MHAIAATTWASNRIDIFWLDPGFAMHHKRFEGADWAIGWDDLGGSFNTAPAAVTLGPNRLDVFGVGADYAMYHRSFNGTWSQQWANLGMSFLSAPAAVVRTIPNISRFLDVFAVGEDHQMYHLIGTVDAFAPGIGWTAWERLGGHFNSAASAITPAPGRLEVFARDRDFTLRHKSWNGIEWSLGWNNLGGQLASPPQAIALGPNRWDVFAIGMDHALWHTWWNGIFWNEWENLGGEFMSAPSITSSRPNQLDVFAIGKEGDLQYRWWDGFIWTDWESLGGNITSAPTVVSRAPTLLNVLLPVENVQSQPQDVVHHTYNIFHRSFDGTAWHPPFMESLAVHLRIPSRYHFAIDWMDPKTTRSLVSDTNYLSSSVRAGGWPAVTQTRLFDGVSGPPWLVNMNFEPITVEPCENVVFNYLIVNNGHEDRQTFDNAVKEIGAGLADAGVKALSGSGLLGTIAGKVTGLLIGFAFADCDGLIAVEQAIFSGKELQAMTTELQPFSKTTNHPGTDSPAACGANSNYDITWSVARVH